MIFKAKGHRFIKATHKTTLEFTKEDYLTEQGDCILGINADFGAQFHMKGRIKIIVSVGDISDELTAEFNPCFDADEMVIRRSGYVDKRTFAINADKAALDIRRDLVDLLKNPNCTATVVIKEHT